MQAINLTISRCLPLPINLLPFNIYILQYLQLTNKNNQYRYVKSYVTTVVTVTTPCCHSRIWKYNSWRE